jgi:uncharacterized membrane protein YeaQ/YmgE (transglycosylase-associated protein family)
MDAPHGMIWWILLGILAGFITGKLMKGSGYGVIADLILGMVGAVVGGWIFHALGLTTTSLVGGLIAAVIGAVIVVALFRLVTKRTVP